jgi:hypothetical protein
LIQLNTIDPFKAGGAALLALTAIYVWWSLRTKTTGTAKRRVDFFILWPLILRGRRTHREKVFLCIGAIVAVLLIATSFMLPK